MKQKKGLQLGEAFGAVLAVVLVAILVIISIYLFTALNTTFSGTVTSTITNENGTINSTGYILSTAPTGINPACGWSSATITSAVNTSGDAVTIPATNYTLSSTGVLTASTATVYNVANISYTYKNGGGACNASSSMISNFTNYPTLIGLVGTIIFLALVIGVLVSAFAFGKKGV